MNRAAINQLKNLLNTTNLQPTDKTSLTSFYTYNHQNDPPELSTRILALHGRPGVGKTHLAAQLLKLTDKKIHYHAPTTHNLPNATQCRSLDHILENIENNTQPTIHFLDDLNLKTNIDPMITMEIPADDNDYTFHQILEETHHNPTQQLLITTNQIYEFEEYLYDRIDTKIRLDYPSIHQKKHYLTAYHKNILTNHQINLLTTRTIGYNYRDLKETIKIAYRLGENTITNTSLQTALQHHQPTTLLGYKVQNPTTITLKNIIGKTQQKQQLHTLITHHKNNKNPQPTRHNLLLFHGPPGTGKTYLVRALSGELNYPIIQLTPDSFYSHNPFQAFQMISHLSKSFTHCIIFIDEAEKTLGNETAQEDTPLLGQFHQILDGIDAVPIKSILILAVNNLHRFSPTLIDRFCLIEFHLPNQTERYSYLKTKQSSMPKKLNFHHLALQTDGMTYRDLDRIYDHQITTKKPTPLYKQPHNNHMYQ